LRSFFIFINCRRCRMFRFVPFLPSKVNR
jgi:hypothetical protein